MEQFFCENILLNWCHVYASLFSVSRCAGFRQNALKLKIVRKKVGNFNFYFDFCWSEKDRKETPKEAEKEIDSEKKN
jgi:hypothetical protein